MIVLVSCSLVNLSPEMMLLAAGVAMVVSARTLDRVTGNASKLKVSSRTLDRVTGNVSDVSSRTRTTLDTICKYFYFNVSYWYFSRSPIVVEDWYDACV